MCRVIIKHYIFGLMQRLDYVGAGVVLPQGPSFKLLVQHFSDIADEGDVTFWKAILGDSDIEDEGDVTFWKAILGYMNVAEGEEFHIDSADALKTLLE